MHTSRTPRRAGLLFALAATLHFPLAYGDDAPAYGSWGVELKNTDASMRPGDDFYRYANGNWLKTAAIPADLPSWGYGVRMHLKAEADVKQVIADLAAANPVQGSVEQKVGDLYASWMDVERLNELGAAPLQEGLARIAAIGRRDALVPLFGNIHFGGPFGIAILADPADTTRYAVMLQQGGLGMPSRDYYLDDGETFAAYRDAYRDYIVRLFELAGVDEAPAKADAILALETELARVHWSPAESRDIQKVYNPMSLAQLNELAPQLPWKDLLTHLGLGNVETLIVAQPSAIRATAALFERMPLDTWKDWLAFDYIRSNAGFLSRDFEQAAFDFNSRTLNGIQQQRDRADRGVQLINGVLGEAVGQVYVKRHFPPSSKAMVEEMVGHLVAAFRERLENNAWMDEATRKQALVKLDAFESRVGYPDKWTDYSALVIDRDDLFGNKQAAYEFHWRQQRERLGGAVDRSLWMMTPQTVNAYYNSLLNQITFPAAMLQPPMFDPQADPAVNYAAIGAVIGHEIGHGFDDQGRRFDETGRIRDWWTVEANERFMQRARKLGAQYAQYEPVDGMHINAELTMGENIGDLGGVEMAYAAYRRHLDACCDGKAPVIDGWTGDQRFFLAYAAAWQRVEREDFARMKLTSDTHSPPEFRVNGVVRNIDAWYRAFDVQADDALYLSSEERVRIW